MKHQTKLDRDVSIERLKSGRRGKLVIVDEDITYHVYPKIVDNKTYVEMWEGGDKDLVCVWLEAEFGVGFVKADIVTFNDLIHEFQFGVKILDTTAIINFKPNI